MDKEELSVEEEMELLAKALLENFSPANLAEKAKETGFVKRNTGKFKAKELLFLTVYSDGNIVTDSLNRSCSKLEAETNISITSQALDLRINESSVSFLKSIYTSLLNKKLSETSSLPSTLGSHFNRIRILDSTSFQLPDKYAAMYQGVGGSSSTAGVKIQLEYDLKTGIFIHINIGHGKDNDNTYGKKLIDTIEKGDLCIRDLGYFGINNFLKIEEKNAFYLSRLQNGVNIYEKYDNESLFKKVDLKEILNKLKPSETIELENVYIGEGKFKTRVIIYKLTEKQLKQRLEKCELKDKKKDSTKELMGLNIYITNIPKEIASKEVIHEIYSLRWQVEIIFKTWKSVFNIDEVKPVKLERFECLLYGKLIAIILSSSLVFKMRSLLLLKKKKELSEIKCICTLKEYLTGIYNAITGTLQDIKQILLRIYNMIEKNGLKSRRKEEKTVFDILKVVYEFDAKEKSAA